MRARCHLSPRGTYSRFLEYIIRINFGAARRIDAAPLSLLQCRKNAPAHAVLQHLVFGPRPAIAVFTKNKVYLRAPIGRRTACAPALTDRRQLFSRAIKRLAFVMCGAHAPA